MSVLIINTLPSGDAAATACIQEIQNVIEVCKVYHTEKMNIHLCIGCYQCILKTPGICAIKDDYEQILADCVRYDSVVYLGQVSELGFVNHALKCVIERNLPLLTFFCCYRNGEIRKILRYNKPEKFSLLLKGDFEHAFLSAWFDRLTSQLNAQNIGVYHLQNAKEMIACIL